MKDKKKNNLSIEYLIIRMNVPNNTLFARLMWCSLDNICIEIKFWSCFKNMTDGVIYTLLTSNLYKCKVYPAHFFEHIPLRNRGLCCYYIIPSHRHTRNDEWCTVYFDLLMPHADDEHESRDAGTPAPFHLILQCQQQHYVLWYASIMVIHAFQLMGNYTFDQKLACFVLYLKIINIFLKNDICFL